MRGSWCRAVHPWQTEAPFVFLDPPLSFDNLWVDEGHQRVGIATTRHIDHEQAERHPYLRSSQANTRCVVHGLNHIIDQALESSVSGHNRLSLATEQRRGEMVDWRHCHALRLSSLCHFLSRTIPRESSLMYSPFWAQAQCGRVAHPLIESLRPRFQTLEKRYRINIHTDSRGPQLVALLMCLGERVLQPLVQSPTRSRFQQHMPAMAILNLGYRSLGRSQKGGVSGVG